MDLISYRLHLIGQRAFLGVDVIKLVFGKASLISVESESITITDVPSCGNVASFWLRRTSRCGNVGAITCVNSLNKDAECCSEMEDSG